MKRVIYQTVQVDCPRGREERETRYTPYAPKFREGKR